MTADFSGRTELLGGDVYDVSPRNEPHRYAVRMLADMLSRSLDRKYVVQAQDAIAVKGWHGNDAPEIDVAVIDRRFYDPMPTAEDAHAFIEVSDTTYRDDRRVKVPMYVRAGVPTWIVNIPARTIEFYGTPDDLALPNGHVFGERESIEVLGVSIAVADLFAPIAER